jgi:hypothetical protein
MNPWEQHVSRSSPAAREKVTQRSGSHSTPSRRTARGATAPGGNARWQRLVFPGIRVSRGHDHVPRPTATRDRELQHRRAQRFQIYQPGTWHADRNTPGRGESWQGSRKHPGKGARQEERRSRARGGSVAALFLPYRLPDGRAHALAGDKMKKAPRGPGGGRSPRRRSPVILQALCRPTQDRISNTYTKHNQPPLHDCKSQLQSDSNSKAFTFSN